MDNLRHQDHSISNLDVPEGLSEAELLYFRDNHSKGKFYNSWGTSADPNAKLWAKWQVSSNPFASEKRLPPVLPSAPYPMGGFKGLPAGTRVMWLGHATTLIEMDGVGMLTDPIFGAAAKITKRHVPPPVPIEELPELSVVMISHGHYDHLDHESLQRLADRYGDSLVYLVPSEARSYLPIDCSQVIEMNWWQSVELDGLRFTFVPAQHWHRRGASDLNKALWGGWVIEGSRRIYFSGDTGYFDGFSLLGKIFEEFDLAILPVGAHEPQWLSVTQHASLEDSIEALIDLNAKHCLGVHWGTYDLSDEPLDHGARVLPRLVQERELDPRCFHMLSHGGALAFENESVIEANSYDELVSGYLRIPDTLFEVTTEEEFETLKSIFRPFRASAGEFIFRDGEEGDQMAYIIRGEVRVMRDGLELAVCGADEFLGEMAIYTGMPRSGDVLAVVDTDVLLISADDLASLRDAGNPIAWRLERMVIGKLTDRFRDSISLQYQQMDTTRSLPRESRPSFLAQLKEWFRRPTKSQTVSQIDAKAVLRNCGMFDEQPDDVLAVLGAMLRPEKVESGHLLFEQGRIGKVMYLIASGSIDVMVTLPTEDDPGKKYRLATRGPGAILGAQGLVDDLPRSADCVTTAETTALTLDRPTWQRLFERDDRIGSAMREAVIKAMSAQLVSVNEQRLDHVCSQETDLAD